MEYIYNGAKQFKYNLPNNILVKLTRRWAFLDKSYKIQQMKKDFVKYPKFLDWVLKTDKMDLQKLQKQHIRDWEVLFFELGAEVLKNLQSFIAANPDRSVQKIKKDLTKTITQVRKAKDPSKLEMLKTQLDRLKALGGFKSIIPSEGVTFVYKGKLYKYTGAFAPVNQILGMLKFTR
jgi:Xaa-Pro aminopeptidase